ncbi:hypothetical protein FRC04_008531 [Tulasnella sp. 424]|nr:hypothetical protein FRC04_008531 [Tulasnella sp. 424]KAG8974003.1 hypothetical protein FRC05_007919 [Tulasnella sp. 425]
MPRRKSYAYTFTPTVTATISPPTLTARSITPVDEEQSIASSGRLHPLDYMSAIDPSSPTAFDPVFHQEGSGLSLEKMMTISAMPGFRHMSIEELRVANWNLERQLSAAGVLETWRVQLAPCLDNSEGDTTRTQKKGELSGIPDSPATAEPSNKATDPPPAVPFGQAVPFGKAGPFGRTVNFGQAGPFGQVAPSPSSFKGTEIKGPSIVGATSGTALTNVEDRKPTSSSSNLGFARFNLPEGYVSLVPPKLGTGTGKFDQVVPAVVTPTPMPAPTANSSPQVHKAPPSGLGSQADTSSITFPLCPAAEQNSTVADAEKEWVHASREARETKAQLAKAQAAHDQAIMMEKLKFKAYYDARNKADE